jgi:hypothetical protein
LKELWVTRARWNGEEELEEEEDKKKHSEIGLRLVKEKIPFQW